MASFLGRLNILAECRSSHLPLWSCPPFLFLVMGAVNVMAMAVSWLFASRYVEEPQVAALVVIAVSVLIFIVGALLINGFQQIAEANRMKSEFIAIVSHQLRSPLSIFKWTLDALGRVKPAAAADQARYLSILGDNTEKMIGLINMLLEVSRIEAGRMALKREAVDLASLTGELVRALAPYVEAARITLRYLARDPLPAVAGDPERLKMVIQNLLDNAIRYSPSGGEVSIRITPLDRRSVLWQIKDRGSGIPQAEQRYIFQRFFRAENAKLSSAQGSGLGLYVARAVIAELGGEMGFTSEEGKGSTFWFRLPVANETKT